MRRKPCIAYDLGVATSPPCITNAPNTPDRDGPFRQSYHVLMEDGFAACNRTMLLANDSALDGGSPVVDALLCKRPACWKWRDAKFTFDERREQNDRLAAAHHALMVRASDDDGSDWTDENEEFHQRTLRGHMTDEERT